MKNMTINTGGLFLWVLLVLVVCGAMARADAPTLPGKGFASARYETLWTKSPFSVASAEAATDSPDYSMVGMAQIDGVSYVSLVDKQSNEHFLITSLQPARGLTLQSVAHGVDAGGTMAVLLRNGQTISLKMEQNAAPALAAIGPPPGIPPNMQNRMPLGPNGQPAFYPGQNGQPYNPAMARFFRQRHRPPVFVPPRPPPVPNQPPQPGQ